ncbi:hypothetical protein ACOMHN_022663 [Nucella lapillus]
MVPPFLQPHPDLQSAVGNAPLSSKHPTHLPTTDCLLSITPLMGGQPSDAPALSPPSPLQQGGQSSNAPALSPPSPLPQGSQPIALALSPSSPLPQDGQPSDAPGLSPSSSTLLLCPSDSTLSICHLNSQSAVKTGIDNRSNVNWDVSMNSHKCESIQSALTHGGLQVGEGKKTQTLTDTRTVTNENMTSLPMLTTTLVAMTSFTHGVTDLDKGRTFVLNPDPMTWPEAGERCQGMGGHLGTIDGLHVVPELEYDGHSRRLRRVVLNGGSCVFAKSSSLEIRSG